MFSESCAIVCLPPFLLVINIIITVQSSTHVVGKSAIRHKHHDVDAFYEKLFGDLSIIGKLLIPTSVSAVYISDAPEVCGIEYISR